MQRKKTGTVILDFETMTQELAEIEEKIREFESQTVNVNANPEFEVLCIRQRNLQDKLKEMYAENRNYRKREKSLTHRQSRER